MLEIIFSLLIAWTKLTFVPDETVIPTLVTISNISQNREGVWRVVQQFSPKPNFNFAMFDYDGWKGCKGILR